MTNWFIVIIGSFLALGILVAGGVIIQKKSKHGAKLFSLLYVFILIWIARFLVNYFACPDEMTGFEKCLDSFVHALQTFSMDEDYTSFTVSGKELFQNAGYPNLAGIYGIVISTINICAPIMGGAIILEVLTGFFPRMRLWLHPRQRKFVFSELNESSIILAEDLCRGDNYRNIVSFESIAQDDYLPSKDKKFPLNLISKTQKPFIIFTDAYADEESEENAELFGRAKALHALCLKTDLQFLSFSHSESVYYFFVDTKEEANITGLSGILERQKVTGDVFPIGNNPDDIKTRIYVFCHSDLSACIVNSISRNDDPNGPVIIRAIPDYTTSAVNLMYEVALFIPLLNKQKTFRPVVQDGNEIDKVSQFYTERDINGRVGGVLPTQELHVTILGGGLLAEEVLKAVYWCGQIAGTQLYIHFITNKAKELQSRIVSNCPELLQSCQEKIEMLKCYPKSNSTLYNPPYAYVDGLNIDIDAEDIAGYPDQILEKSDYFVIALGNDQKNIATALMLKQQLSRRQLNRDEKSHPVIAAAVYDKRLADSIVNLQPIEYEPYLVPFAMLQDRYSCRNVFMSDITVDAWKGGSLYDKKSHEKRKKDEYSYWANIYRAIHAPYKMYAFGLIRSVDLSLEPKLRYQGGGKVIQPNDLAYSWMEHRRWNACIRAQGFTMPTDTEHERYFIKTKLHKDLSRKYHNCLVESSVRGAQMPKDSEFDMSLLDALDIESIKAYKMKCQYANIAETPEGLQDAEYKQWDDFCNDASAQQFWSNLS